MKPGIAQRLEKFQGLNKDMQKCPPNPSMTVREAIQLADYIAELERRSGLVVMRFDHDEIPQFHQGYQDHEVVEPVTAEECNWFVNEIATLRKKVDELGKDAARWNAISTLMIIGNVALDQDEEGCYSISVDPVENIITFGWVGNTPEEVADKAVSKLASLEEGEKLNEELPK